MQLDAGIDTWSVGWYLAAEGPAEKAVCALATAKVKRFDALPGDVAEHKVLYDRTHRFLVAEGHPNPDGLAPVDAEALLAAQEAIADGLEELGVQVPRDPGPFDRPGSPGAAGVRRLDLAVDLQGQADQGRAILSGVAAIEPPGLLRSVVHRAKVGRAIETVSWQGARGKVGRVYDKGVEQLTHRAGEKIRFEDQRRYPSGTRPLVDELSPEYARAMFSQRFAALRKATKGVVVASEAEVIGTIEELVDEGVLTATEAVKVMGYLVLERGGAEVGLPRTTAWRFRKLAREAGVVLASSDLEDDLRIDLGGCLDQVIEDAQWAARN